MDEPPRGGAIGRTIGLVALHLALVVWLTWPLGARLTTHVPHTREIASTDLSDATWVLAYEAHTLATHPTRLLDANVYHPTPRALFYGQTYLGALPLFAPVYWATGNPTLAINVVFLGGLALTSAALHWVVWRWTASHAAGLLAGWAFLLSRWVSWWFVPTVPPYGLLWGLPLIVYLVAGPMSGWRQTGALAVLLVVQSLTDPVFVAGAAIVPVVAIGLSRLARRAVRPQGLRLLAAVGLALVALVPVYAGYVDVWRREPDLRSVWLPVQLTAALPGGLLAQYAPTSLPYLVFPLLLAGTIVCLVWPREHADTLRAWATTAMWVFVSCALSLERAIVPGVGTLRMPHFVILEWFGAPSMLRVAIRFGVSASIGLALLAGLAFAACTTPRQRGYRGGWTSVVAGLLMMLWYAECRGGWLAAVAPREPLPPAYPVEETIGPSAVTEALRRSDAVVLELPLLPRGIAGRPHAKAMFRSIFHWRPLLNGYRSYYPTGFAERMDLAQRVPDPVALATLQRDAGLTHVLVNVGSAFARSVWLRAAAAPGSELRLVAEDDAILLFEVTPVRPG